MGKKNLRYDMRTVPTSLSARTLPGVRRFMVEALRNPAEYWALGKNEAIKQAATLERASLWWSTPKMTAYAQAASSALGTYHPGHHAPDTSGLTILDGLDLSMSFYHAAKDQWVDGPFGPVPPEMKVCGARWAIEKGVFRLSPLVVPAEYPHLLPRLLHIPVLDMGTYFIPLDEPQPPTGEYAEIDMPLLAVLTASWVIAQESTVVNVERVPERGGRGGGSAATSSDDVMIVRLRKQYHRPAGTPAPKVEYRRSREFCWPVAEDTGGFFRTYWTGPGGTTPKKKWVASYIAGPKDKPLRRHADRVNLICR